MHVSRLGAIPSQPAQADHLTVGDAFRKRDFDFTAGRQRDALLRLARDVFKRHGQRRRNVLAAPPTRALTSLGRAERLAEQMREDIISAARPAPKRASGAEKSQAKPSKSLSARPTTTAAEPLKALESRLAVGVDLAAVELGALRRVTQDFVGHVDLGEFVLRLRIAGVAIRMMSFWRACDKPS